MKKIAVIDCETDPFREGRIPEPFLWGVYAEEFGYHEFKTARDAVEFCEEHAESHRFYAHNGGKFDFHYMLDLIPTWRKIAVINGRIARFHIGECEFVDSFCILPVALSAYQKTKIDYDIFEADQREKPENAKLISDYLRDDCVFTHELISKFIAEHGFSLTIASAAIKKLQKIEGIKIPDSGRTFFEDLRPYYFGGRVQCFKKGVFQRGKFNVVDINSAYPYAMTHAHPAGTCTTFHDARPRKILGPNFYTVRAISRGALPLRADDGRLEFPDDETAREYKATGWEILAGLETGTLKILEHVEQKIFHETRDFSRYVEYFYAIKQTSKKGSAEQIFAKLFLNSAYGKFCADPEKYKTTMLCDITEGEEAMMQGYDIVSEIHDKYIISCPILAEEQRHYNIATGASITGFVRAYLWRALQEVGTPYYCDTDSIIFSGRCALEIGDELGAWKNEGVFDTGGIGGKKIYAFKNSKTGAEKTACKGVRLDFEEIIKVCSGKSVIKTSHVPVYSLKNGKKFLTRETKMT